MGWHTTAKKFWEILLIFSNFFQSKGDNKQHGKELQHLGSQSEYNCCMTEPSKQKHSFEYQIFIINSTKRQKSSCFFYKLSRILSWSLSKVQVSSAENKKNLPLLHRHSKHKNAVWKNVPVICSELDGYQQRGIMLSKQLSVALPGF